MAATEIWLASKPRIRRWSGKRGFACENWKSDWLDHRPIAALTAIQVGASSRTCDDRISVAVAGEPDVRRRDRLGLAGRVLDAEPVDQNETA